MLNVQQFRINIVEDTLAMIGERSVSAVELLLGTAIQESSLTYLVQLGGGPAAGLFQMEPATHNDIWKNYLSFREDLALRVLTLSFTPGTPNAMEMIGNMHYACAMARMLYKRVPEALPEAGDVEGMANYWKEHYNTHEGAGTVEEYIENWHEATFVR